VNGVPDVNGNYGSVNLTNFLRAPSPTALALGFHALPTAPLDALLAGPGGSVAWRAWVSPRHFIMWNGHNSNNGTVFKTVFGEMKVEYSPTKWAGELCKLLPADFRKHFSNEPMETEISLFHCWARLLNTHTTGEGRWVMPVRFGVGNPFDHVFMPPEPTLRLYQKSIIASDPADGVLKNTMAYYGDSGAPLFLGVNGSLVILSHVSSYGNMGTTMYSDYIGGINTAMNELSVTNADPDLATVGSYAVQTVDLSGFIGGVVTPAPAPAPVGVVTPAPSSSPILPPQPPITPPPVLYLREYLQTQQSLICGASLPGSASQRGYVNGNGTGGVNPNLFLKKTVAGYDGFNVDVFLNSPAIPGTCSSRVYISSHHYLLACGYGHNKSLVDTNTTKRIGYDTRLEYDPVLYTGVIAKLLPSDTYRYIPTVLGDSGSYVNTGGPLPAFCRLANTNQSGESWWVQPANAWSGSGGQFLPGNTLLAWQQQFSSGYLGKGGDSGSPIFCGIKGDTVLLGFVCCLGTVGAGEHPGSTNQLIKDKMQELAQYYNDPNWNTYAPLVVNLADNFKRIPY